MPHESHQETDYIVIRKVLDGDSRAFDTLVSRHLDAVFRFIYKIISNVSDREEVCQDVFVKVYMNLAQFRFDAKFTTWLYQIAYRTAISSTRRKKYDFEEYQDDIASQERDSVSDEEVKRILDKELAKLKLEERTMITLHYLQDVSVDDISDIVDRPVGTVKSMLHRVRQKLHTSLTRSEPAIREAV